MGRDVYLNLQLTRAQAPKDQLKYVGSQNLYPWCVCLCVCLFIENTELIFPSLLPKWSIVHNHMLMNHFHTRRQSFQGWKQMVHHICVPGVKGALCDLHVRIKMR